MLLNVNLHEQLQKVMDDQGPTLDHVQSIYLSSVQRMLKRNFVSLKEQFSIMDICLCVKYEV